MVDRPLRYPSLVWAFRILGLGPSGRSREERKHIWRAIIVVALSVMPLVIAMFLANGMTSGLTERYISLTSYHAQIHPVGLEPEVMLEKIHDDLSAAAPGLSLFQVRESFAMLYADDGSTSCTIKGLERDYIELMGSRGVLTVTKGGPFSESEPSILLSEATASELGVSVGDSLAVVTVTQSSGQPRLKPALFTVTGLYTTGYKQLDQSISFISSAQARRMIRDDDALYMAVIYPQGAGVSPLQIREQIETASEELFYVITWDELNRSLYANFRTSSSIIYIIMVLIILVASIHISSTSIVVVQQRYAQIGLLKSIGIPRRLIRRTFLYVSLCIGLLGSVIGIVLGLLLSSQLSSILKVLQGWGIAALDFYLIDLPLIIHWYELVLIVLCACVTAALASAVPLRKVDSILPIHLLGQ